MKDTDEIKKQPIRGLQELRQHIAQLEALVAEHKRTEEALATAELRYCSLFEQSPDGVLIIDNQTLSVIEFNDAACRQLGYTRDEFAGIKVFDFEALQTPQETLTHLAEIKRGGHEFTTKHRTKQGAIRDVLVKAKPFEIGGKLYHMTIHHDITELKQAENAFKESGELYRLLTESSHTGIFIQQGGKFAFVNDRFARMHGYEVRELLGMEYWLTVHPSQRDMVAQRASKRLAGQVIEEPFEYLRLRKDGTSFWCSVMATRIEYQGMPAIMGNIIDTSEQKKAEQALRESEARYRTLVESSQTGIFIIQDDRFVYVNERFAQMHGYKTEEMLGMSYLDLIHPDLRENISETAAKRLRGEQIPEKTLLRRVFKKDGQTFWSESITAKIEYGGRPAIMGNIVDVTEREKLEAEKAEMEQRAQVTSRLASVGELAAGIAHEINNPLTGVIGYAELLSSRSDLPEDVTRDLETIDKGAKRVADIVKRLLMFARQTKPTRDYVSINELIQNTLELRAYQLRTSNIQVTTEFDANLPITVADAGQLQQVFLNIIANAETEMKLAHGKGALLIKTEKPDHSIRISFQDDGPGISRENLKKIFDPFFTTKEVGQGTGLGLSICHGIIAEHGGRIWAESEPGKGAAFFVELPVVTEKEKIEKARKDAEEPEKKITGSRILVVDDEEIIRQFLSRVLSEQGHEVEAVDNAEAALEKIKNERYRLILLDMKMPGMNGMELYQHIKEIASSLTKRVVFVTGDVMGADTEKFLAETKARYITKPFDARQLKQEISRLLG